MDTNVKNISASRVETIQNRLAVPSFKYRIFIIRLIDGSYFTYGSSRLKIYPTKVLITNYHNPN